uniref:Uncharacterized protein n=1 Tax=Pararge aegeria TaxID=116150 RepID=S4PUZ1_9NEOP
MIYKSKSCSVNMREEINETGTYVTDRTTFATPRMSSKIKTCDVALHGIIKFLCVHGLKLMIKSQIKHEI